MWAASRGHADVVNILVRHGASLDLRDKIGQTALLKATLENHVAVVDLLLAAGADTELMDEDTWSPLTGAIYYGYTDMVARLSPPARTGTATLSSIRHCTRRRRLATSRSCGYSSTPAPTPTSAVGIVRPPGSPITTGTPRWRS